MLHFLAFAIGLLILSWGLGAGFAKSEDSRAEIFTGPVGCGVNGVVVLLALSLLYWSFFGG